MDTIREYLNNMFLGFPETPAVLRAKAELLEMMEDKFEECKNEGKSDAEAVGTVISEFGNIEELAKELGIEEYLHEKSAGQEERGKESESQDGFQRGSGTGFQTGYTGQGMPTEYWELSRAKEFLSYTWKHAFMVAAGVACFIMTVFLNSILDALGDYGIVNSEAIEFFGDAEFVIGVAAGVVILIYAKEIRKRYLFIKKRSSLRVEREAAEYVKAQRITDEERCFRLRLIGIVLFICSVFPGMISNLIPVHFLSELLDNALLLFAAAGVFLVITAGSVESRYEEFAKAAFFHDSMEQGYPQTNENQVFYGYQKKHRRWVLLVILLFVVWIVVSSLIGGVIAFFSYKRNTGNESASSFTYDPASVKKIEMELETEDLEIRSGEGSKITLDYRGSGTIIEGMEGEALVVKCKGKSHGILPFFHLSLGSFGSRAGKVVVTIPKEEELSKFDTKKGVPGKEFLTWLGTKRDFSIDVDTGSVLLEQVTGNQIKISADTGSVTLREVYGRDWDIEADTGSVKMRGAAGENINIEADVGSVDLEMVSFQNMGCDLDTGSFQLGVPMTKEAFLETYATDFDTGLDSKVSLFGEKLSEKEASVSKGGDAPALRVQTDVGSITIREER